MPISLGSTNNTSHLDASRNIENLVLLVGQLAYGSGFANRVLIRDNTGARIGVGTIAVPANGHSAFVLSDQFPATANVSGTIEFGTPSNSQISVLGFRFPQSGAFSTIPVLAP